MVAAALDMFSLPTLAASANSDRRGSARSSLYILAQVQGSAEPMWACDISLGGMQCRSSLPRWPGTYLDVSFALPDTREEIRVGAQVVSLGQLGDGELTLGLRFCRITAGAQMAIYRFLDRRRPLWSGVVEAEPASKPCRGRELPAVAALLARKQPFAALLGEAHRTLRDTQPAARGSDSDSGARAGLLARFGRLLSA